MKKIESFDTERYLLMRKNDIFGLCEIDNLGNINRFKVFDDAIELAPLEYKNDSAWIKKWWSDRAVPSTQKNIFKILKEQNIDVPSQYLVKNLGLSLCDYYWIKPIDCQLKWENVSLFRNPFHGNIEIEQKLESDKTLQYTPNGSLQGNLEKSWTIANDERCLLKGNHSHLSSESINEVFVSEIYKLQGYNNYTPYKLVKIPERPYVYGCISKLFTSESLEAVSFHAIKTSQKKSGNISIYEFIIKECQKHGINEELLRQDLDKMLFVDFLLTGYDRHLNNISVLRDAESLQFVRLAPIYDSGSCLFADLDIPHNIKEMAEVKINSFTNKEIKQLRLIRDKNCIDLTKVPDVQFLRNLYEKDSNCEKGRIDKICRWYEKKINICRNVQLGKDPFPSLFTVPTISQENTFIANKEVDSPVKDVYTQIDKIINTLIDLYQSNSSEEEKQRIIVEFETYIKENNIDDLTDRIMEIDTDNVLPDFIYGMIYVPHEYGDND